MAHDVTSADHMSRAFVALSEAALVLHATGSRHGMPPRGRVWRLDATLDLVTRWDRDAFDALILQWPYGPRGETTWASIIELTQEHPTQVDGLSRQICDDVSWDPRRILRIIRRLGCAAQWCEARVAGIERHLLEIERQQGAYLSTIRAEIAAARLRGE